MTKAERLKKLEQMPVDYRPQTPLAFMAIFFDHEEGVKALSDDQAGKVFKRLFDYSQAYAISYDDNLTVDVTGLEPMTAYIAKQLAGGIKRAAQSNRESSFLRSGANNGGRPSNKT